MMLDVRLYHSSTKMASCTEEIVAKDIMASDNPKVERGLGQLV